MAGSIKRGGSHVCWQEQTTAIPSHRPLPWL